MEARRRSHSFCEQNVVQGGALEQFHSQVGKVDLEDIDFDFDENKTLYQPVRSRTRSCETPPDDLNFGPPLPNSGVRDGAMQESYCCNDNFEESASQSCSRSKSLYGSEDASFLPLVVVQAVPAEEQEKDYTMESRTGALRSTEIKALQEGLISGSSTRPDSLVREEEEERRVVAAERHDSFTGLPQPRKIKLLLLGDSGVGKSSLINRWTEDTFAPTLISTVGVDFKQKMIQLPNGEVSLGTCSVHSGRNIQNIIVQVWDTAGQEKFHKITTAYYKGAHGILLVYDVSNSQSLQNVKYWMDGIQRSGNLKVQVALIGNKLDMRNLENSGHVSSQEGRSAADQSKVPYFETSAKTGECVEEAFSSMALSVFKALYADSPSPASDITSEADDRLRNRIMQRRTNSLPNGSSSNVRNKRKSKSGCMIS